MRQYFQKDKCLHKEMLWKKKVNTFIFYSVNYIVDKLNDSHYGGLWRGKEDRREGKDSFRLVMYFKHTLIFLNNNDQNEGAVREHPELSCSRPWGSDPVDTFLCGPRILGTEEEWQTWGQASGKAWWAGQAGL